jgi:galactokinase
MPSASTCVARGCARSSSTGTATCSRRSTRGPADGLAQLPEPLRRRARHVISENERVDATVAALGGVDLAGVGRLLDASHASLRDDYEVSVPEVEEAVAACKQVGALGARIVGGGFGGSVLALFPPGAEPPRGAVRVDPGSGARVI